jgi:hypothetical protein
MNNSEQLEIIFVPCLFKINKALQVNCSRLNAPGVCLQSRLQNGQGSPLAREVVLCPGDVHEVGKDREGAKRDKGKPEQIIHHTPLNATHV